MGVAVAQIQLGKAKLAFEAAAKHWDETRTPASKLEADAAYLEWQAAQQVLSAELAAASEKTFGR